MRQNVVILELNMQLQMYNAAVTEMSPHFLVTIIGT